MKDQMNRELIALATAVALNTLIVADAASARTSHEAAPQLTTITTRHIRE